MKPFKKKCEWAKSYSGDDVPVNDKHIMTHALIESIHGDKVHAGGAKLQAQYYQV